MDLMHQQNDDHEAGMARADLFKCAQYSFKLFKMIHDGQQLEGWVQAKITKAADYIASVYHYMEYEMKFSEYGEQIENSDMYSESQRIALKNMLTEAKATMKKLTKAQAEKIKEGAKKSDVPAFQRKAKGGDWKVTTKDLDKEEHEGKLSHKKTLAKNNGKAVEETSHQAKTTMKHVKNPTAGEKKAAKDIKAGTAGYSDRVAMLKSAEKDGRLKEASKRAKKDYDGDGKVETGKDEYLGSKIAAAKKAGKIKEASKPDFLDMDKDGNKKEPMKKAVADKKKNPFAKVKETSSVFPSRNDPAKKAAAASVKPGTANPAMPSRNKTATEASKPSAGMSTGAKSALVKKATAGKDIGKPGKSFDKVAKAAGGGEKGKKIAAAAMWKNAAK